MPLLNYTRKEFAGTNLIQEIKKKIFLCYKESALISKLIRLMKVSST